VCAPSVSVTPYDGFLVADSYSTQGCILQHIFKTPAQMLSKMAVVLQMGPLTSSYMYHLLSAVNAHAEKNQPRCEASHASNSEDPLVILPMDSKNAFNALNSQQLVHFLQEGCETHAPNLSPSNEEGCTDDPSPYCWDALWPYFAAHYGCHSSLKYYSSGTTSVVQSQPGVQQGDPLGSTLFALGIHPILLNLGHHHPRI
jgi:hypothetical protein